MAPDSVNPTKKLFEVFADRWAAAVGHIERSPVLTHTVRRRDGTVVEVANNRPKDVRASNVKWLTPRTYRLWRDIGLRGYTAAGLPQPGWRGRTSTSKTGSTPNAEPAKE